MTDHEPESSELAFTPEQISQIENAIATPGGRTVCPVCDGPLEVGAPLGAGHSVSTLWEVRCSDCGRHAIARDIPQRLRKARDDREKKDRGAD